MNRLALLLLFVALPVLAAQTGYRIVHPDGTVEYTDQPPAENGAETVPLPDVQTFEAPPPPAMERPEATAPKQNEPGVFEYNSLEVVQPHPGEHVWVSQWEAPVVLDLSPGLAPEHEIVVTVDGSVVARGTRTRFSVSPIYRGEHRISARVVDQSGDVLIASEPVTFYIHKHQANRP